MRPWSIRDVMGMKKAKRQKETGEDFTPVAVVIAALCGVTALYCGEIIYDNIKDSGAPDMRELPGWRAHMASASVPAGDIRPAVHKQSFTIYHPVVTVGGAYRGRHRDSYPNLRGGSAHRLLQPMGILTHASNPLTCIPAREPRVDILSGIMPEMCGCATE